MKKFFGIGLCLLLGLSTLAKVDVDETNDVVESLTELRELFVEHQTRWVPLALPGDGTLFQNYGLTVPVQEKGLPRRFMKRLIDYGSGDFPVYQITCTENYLTRQVSVYDSNTGLELWTFSVDPLHDPYAVLRSVYDLTASDSFDGISEAEIQRMDSAKVAAEFTLVPEEYYADYLLAKEQVRELETMAAPMMMEMSSPVQTEVVSTLLPGSNGLMTLYISLPDTFGDHVEIFSRDHLEYWGHWEVAENRLPPLEVGSLNGKMRDRKT